VVQERVRRVASWGLLVAAGGLVLGACGGGGQVRASAAPAPPPPAASSAAAPTTAAPTTTSAAAERPLAAVFPGVADPACAPADASVRTSGGAVPTEAYVCDYSSVAAGARLVLAEWPDVAAAQAWLQDTEALGPRIEEFDLWQVGGVEQGPLYTAQQPGGGTVFSTGIYEGLPYGWEIQTATLDESNAVFADASQDFQPSSQLGG
jgi:hypothetical protein